MTWYEFLQKCSIKNMANFIIGTQFRRVKDCKEFLGTKEYQDAKKLMIEFLNSNAEI